MLPEGGTSQDDNLGVYPQNNKDNTLPPSLQEKLRWRLLPTLPGLPHPRTSDPQIAPLPLTIHERHLSAHVAKPRPLLAIIAIFTDAVTCHSLPVYLSLLKSDRSAHARAEVSWRREDARLRGCRRVLGDVFGAGNWGRRKGAYTGRLVSPNLTSLAIIRDFRWGPGRRLATGNEWGSPGLRPKASCCYFSKQDGMQDSVTVIRKSMLIHAYLFKMCYENLNRNIISI